MVDWNGLFKWSMKYQEQEHSTDVKPMDQETQKWLQEAMEDYTYNEAKRMKEIIDEISKEELKTEEDQKKRYELLDELMELVEGLENARDLHTLGGLKVLMNVMFNSNYLKNRLIALQIFNSCNQNNAKVQYESIQLQGFHLINIILNDKADMKEREHCYSALSALVRGEHLEGKRQFIDADGVEFVLKSIQEIDSQKIQFKAMSLLRDLVLYDDRLHLTINNTENFANTNAQKQEKQTEFLFKDENAPKDKNEKEENKKFQGIVKNKLKESKFLQIWTEKIVGETSEKCSEYRAAYLEIMTALIKQFEEVKLEMACNFDGFKQHLTKLLEIKKNEDASVDFEIEKWKEMMTCYLQK